MKTEEQKNTDAIVFHIGEETKPVVFNHANYREALFASQMNHALSLICERTKLVKAYDGLSGESGRGEEYDALFNDIYDNNIISFIGERGSGKSSCMYSVINVLKENEKGLGNDGDKLYSGSNTYSFLATIDPSFFDVNHNILQLVIGKMYASFRHEIETNGRFRDSDRFEQDVNRLTVRFQDTKRHLKYLDSKPQYEDDNELEELCHLSAGIDLRGCLHKLICEYLRLVQKRMLVITIDDIDLNTEQAYGMVEQIRRYLILPNVIILMAVKLDQLSDVIRLRLTGQYQTLLKDNRMREEVIAEMSDRYLTKLLPLEHRIYMPDIAVYMDSPLVIVPEQGESTRYESIKMAVPSLIFAKCRYLFYNTQGTTSLIVPRNLRDLRMLLSMLYRMPEYNGQAADDSGTVNKTIFKKYFFGAWLNVLEEPSRRIALNLIQVDEPTKLNKIVVQELKKRYNLNQDSNKELHDWNEILQDNVMNYNLSMGDAFAVIDHVGRVYADMDTQRLIFFVKALYSIRLYEYYDRMTDALDHPEAASAGSGAQSGEERPNRHDDFLKNISDYRKLVGGSFFHLNGNTLLPSPDGEDETEGTGRERRLVNKAALTDLIRKIKKAYPSIKEMGAQKLSAFTDDLKTAEFFMLAISRHYFTKNRIQEVGSYRRRREAYYDRSLQQVQNVLFDITAPFFTLLDVEHAYGRFDEEIFAIAKEWNYEDDSSGEKVVYNSLYREMLQVADETSACTPERTSEHNLLSRAGIRNAEVADDLFQRLLSLRGKYRPGGKKQDILSDFYKNIAAYVIATYDKREKEPADTQTPAETDRYYTIQFTPFGVLSEFLKNTNHPLFDKIFQEVKTDRQASVVPDFDFIDRDMTRTEIWASLVDAIPGLDPQYEEKLYRAYFKKADEVYAKEKIRKRLQWLAQGKTWAVLRQASTTEQ